MLVIIYAAAFSGSALAQVNVDVNAGYLMPTGDFADNSKAGFSAGADVFFGLPMLPLEIGGRVAYNYFGAEDKFEDGSTSIIEILPSVRYVLGPPLSPVKIFGQFGAGLYNWKNEFDVKGQITQTEDDGSDFGICFGVGVRGKLGPVMGIMAMPMYHIIMTEDENTTYISLNVGVVF